VYWVSMTENQQRRTNVEGDAQLLSPLSQSVPAPFLIVLNFCTLKSPRFAPRCRTKALGQIERGGDYTSQVLLYVIGRFPTQQK